MLLKWNDVRAIFSQQNRFQEAVSVFEFWCRYLVPTHFCRIYILHIYNMLIAQPLLLNVDSYKRIKSIVGIFDLQKENPIFAIRKCLKRTARKHSATEQRIRIFFSFCRHTNDLISLQIFGQSFCHHEHIHGSKLSSQYTLL